MPAGTYNTSVAKGETLSRTFTITNIDTGTAIDLTGATASMVCRETLTSGASVSFTAYLTIPTGTDGVIRLQVPASVTANMAVREWKYDLKVTFPNSTVRVYLAGNITVTQGVT